MKERKIRKRNIGDKKFLMGLRKSVTKRSLNKKGIIQKNVKN